MTNDSSNIRALLFRKELRLLAGSGFRNFITLFIISFLSLFAVSIAWNSHHFLELRMSDPYTNLLNIPKLDAYESDWDRIQRFLFEKENMNALGIKTVSSSYYSNLKIFNSDCKNTRVLMGQTFHPQEDAGILQRILETNNLDTCDFKRGIILSESALYDLGFSWSERDKIDELYLKRDFGSEMYFAIPVRVIKVVRQLPNRKEFIIHPKLNDRLKDRFSSTGLYRKEKEQIGFELLTPDQSSETDQLIQKIQALPQVEKVVLLNEKYNNRLHRIAVSLKQRADFEDRFRLFSDMILDKHETQNIIFIPQPNEFYWSRDSIRSRASSLNFVVNFDRLGEIRQFADTMKSLFDYPVDLTSVETKENFKLTSLTTKLLVFCLVVFALVSILVFISSMFKSHLRHISRNIGTIIAFGYRPRELQSIYLYISAFMTITVLALSLVILVLTKPIVGPALHAFIYQGAAGKGELLFEPMNMWTLITCLVVFTGALLVTWTACRKILKKTPGDLIYQRIK